MLPHGLPPSHGKDVFPGHLARGQAWELSGMGMGDVFYIRGVHHLLPSGTPLSTQRKPLWYQKMSCPRLLSQRTRNESNREGVQPPQGHTAINRRNRSPHQPAKISGAIMGSTGQSVMHSMDTSVLEFQTLVIPVN